MERESGFYTMKGYSLHTEGGLTSAMEDYLETVSYTHLTLPTKA